jgi:hypothetical protein
MHKVEQNCTPKKTNPTKCPKFKCNTVSVSFSASRCSLIVFSSKVGREKKKNLETGLWMAICIVAHLPTAVSLLLLEALFMQISGVSLTLTWSCRLCLLRVLLFASHSYKLSPFQAHWGRWHCTSFLRPACLFTVHVGSGSSLPSCGVFLPPPLLQAFLLLIAERTPPIPLEPLWPGRLVYLQFREGFPSPPFSTQCAPPSLLRVFILIAYYSVSLFSLGRGLSVQGAMLIWPRVVCGSTTYCLAHLVCVFPSRLGAGVWQWPRSPPGFSI